MCRRWRRRRGRRGSASACMLRSIPEGRGGWRGAAGGAGEAGGVAVGVVRGRDDAPLLLGGGGGEDDRGGAEAVCGSAGAGCGGGVEAGFRACREHLRGG